MIRAKLRSRLKVQSQSIVPRPDAYICDVIVIPTDAAADDMGLLVGQLTAAGLEVREVRTDQAVIEGTIDSTKIRQLEHLSGVQYVRCVYSYWADFPEDESAATAQPAGATG